ncbi:hypothetical protein [Lentibacillus persicus]|nr:hypothetical protein [Lentibacillus persicus]
MVGVGGGRVLNGVELGVVGFSLASVGMPIGLTLPSLDTAFL